MRRPTVALVVLLLLAIPGAVAAPKVEIEVLAPAEPMVPSPEWGVVPVRVHVGCDAAEAYASQTYVGFTVPRQPAYANVRPRAVNMRATWAPTDCADPDARQTFYNEVWIRLSPYAPAYEIGVYELKVTVTRATSHGPFLASFNVTNGYTHALDVAPALVYAQGKAGQVVTFPLDVRNDANGATAVELLAEPFDPVLWILEPRQSFVLAPRTGDPSDEVPLHTVSVPVRIPHAAEPGDQFFLIANFTYGFTALDGPEGPTAYVAQQLGVEVVEDSSISAEQVPAPSIWLAVAFLGFLAWRRRHH